MKFSAILFATFLSSFSTVSALPNLANYRILAKRFDNSTDLTSTPAVEQSVEIFTEDDATTTSTWTSTVFITLSATESSTMSSTDDSTTSSLVSTGSSLPSSTTPSEAAAASPSSAAASPSSAAASPSSTATSIDDLISSLQEMGKDANLDAVNSILGTSVISATCAAPVTVTVTQSAASSDLVLPSGFHKAEVTSLSTGTATTTITVPITATFTITQGSSLSILTTTSNVETILEQTSTITITSTATVSDSSSSTQTPELTAISTGPVTTTEAFVSDDITTFLTLTVTSTQFSTLSGSNSTYHMPSSYSSLDSQPNLAKRNWLSF